jgi:hypothetical protein
MWLCVISNALWIASLLFLGCAGCGVHQGRYTVTGETFNAFENRVGGIAIVDGFGIAPTTADVESQDLLYIVIVGSTIEWRGPSIDQNDRGIISVFNFSWTTDEGNLASSIEWNRNTDSVAIGKQEFDRQKGNEFLVTIDSGGFKSQQMTNFSTHYSFQQVLENAQNQTMVENPIHSAQLSKSEHSKK